MTAFSTIPQLVLAARDRHPHNIALENDSGSIRVSYSDLVAQTDLWSRHLAGNIAPGRRIALVMDAGIELTQWLLATMWRHCVFPLNPSLSDDELRRYLARSKTDLVIASRVSSPLGEICQDLGIGLRSPEQILSSMAVAADLAHLPDADSVAIVLLTTGSTGMPRVVPLTHRNVTTSTDQMASALDASPKDRCLVLWAQYHIGGLVDHLLLPLSTGGTIISAGRFEFNKLISLLGSARPTWMQFVPATLDETIRESNRRSIPLTPNTLRFIRCVAAPMNEDLWHRAERAFGCPLVHAYGMTEASPLVTETPLDSSVRKPDSCGRSFGTEIKIVDDDQRELPPGIPGSILIRGDNVFAGYEDDTEYNATRFVDGWFRTGDLGYLDEDGDLFVEGREQNLINRGGEKVNPVEVESVLLNHPRVREAVVFALPHERLGSVVGAAVSTTHEISQDELIALVGSRLSPHKVPVRILILPELPWLGVGKIDRMRLARLAEESSIDEEEEFRTPTERTVAEIWAEELDVDNLTAVLPLSLAGGDSLSATRIVAEVERLFHLGDRSRQLLQTSTIRSMAQTIDSLTDTRRHRSTRIPAAGSLLPRWDNSLGVEDFVQRIVSAENEVQREYVQELARTHLTGNEIEVLLQSLDHLEGFGREKFPKLCKSRPLISSVLRTNNAGLRAQWSRMPLQEFVSIYRRVDRRATQVTLLAFSGTAGRLMVPISRILSNLPSEIDTVVLIADPDRDHFESGIRGVVDNLADLPEALIRMLPKDVPSDFRTIGTSAGGLAAAVTGLTLKLTSFGLLSPDSPHRHPRAHAILDQVIGAGEQRTRGRIISGSNPRDLEGLRDLRIMLPNTTALRSPSRNHNVFGPAWRLGMLPRLLRWLTASE